MAQRLTLPVLVIGGGASSGEGPANAVKLAADNVEALVIPDEVITALTSFLAS
jgi:hypothetical protein